MGLRINTNIAAINAQNNLNKVGNRLFGNFARLSSGLRIATAADDAAGLATSERITAEIRGLQQASRNANDATSLAQTADGAAAEIGDILKRLKELILQAKNGTVGNADKDTINVEFGDLINEIDRIAKSTEFNDIKLLDGTNTAITFQVGTGSTTNDSVSLTLSDVDKTALSLQSLSVASNSTAATLNTALSNIDSAINTLNTARGRYGAAQGRIASVINNLGSAVENLSAANSRIRDVDVAFETSQLTRNSIIQQSAIAILAQANIQPQVALSLLG